MSNLSIKCTLNINTKSVVLDGADFVEYDFAWNFPI